jgi:DNA-binding NtrC family response regulator
VLLVEDADYLRELLSIVLKSMDLDVLEAPLADQAIVIAESHPQQIDLLLTDIEIKCNSGWVIADQISRVQPQIRVVYMSGGITRPEWRDHKARVPGSYFIQKPFRLKALKALLTELLLS